MACRCNAILAACVIVLFASCWQPVHAQQGKEIGTLKVGDTAPDVEFQPLVGDEKIKLSTLTEDGPVVLVVLRGFPGYQCPICFRQMGELVKHADEIARLGAKVVLVYPGPAENLGEKAGEFLKDIQLPEPFVFVIDPDYAFTNLYNLRWDEPRETAYPSTFVLDSNRQIVFRVISDSHGGRAKTTDVLEILSILDGDSSATGQGIPQDGGPVRVTR
jgi:thioredoxin-dependent peroxiredoxin